jgi:hypothetical protein
VSYVELSLSIETLTLTIEGCVRLKTYGRMGSFARIVDRIFRQEITLATEDGN